MGEEPDDLVVDPDDALGHGETLFPSAPADFPIRLESFAIRVKSLSIGTWPDVGKTTSGCRAEGRQCRGVRRGGFRAGGRSGAGARSEEHTSELQSLMRISYAVF